jgi:hypothetical protein
MTPLRLRGRQAWTAWCWCFATLATLPSGSAAEIVLDASAIGYVSRSPGAVIQHDPQDRHLTGSQGNGLFQVDRHSYFGFDLSGVSGTIVGASFRVYTSNPRSDAPEGGYWSGDASETFALHEFAGNAAALLGFATTNFYAGSPEYAQLDALFVDLADGPLLGSVVMTEAEAEEVPGVVPGQPGGKIWELPLSVAAVGSLNAAASTWIVGGSLTTAHPPVSTTSELLFSGSVPFSSLPGRATPKPQLVLTVVAYSADFDDDGAVTGSDLLRWQRHLGQGGQSSNANGDASGDGVVGPEDLALWKGQFGAGAAAAVVRAVPEPGGATAGRLAFIAVGLAGRARSRRLLRGSTRRVAWPSPLPSPRTLRTTVPCFDSTTS